MTTKTRTRRSRRTNVERRDVHQQVTDNIIAAIEAGAGEWQMPWHRSGKGLNRPVNIDTRAHYRGVNILNLWVAGEARGYTEGVWGTYGLPGPCCGHRSFGARRDRLRPEATLRVSTM